VSSDGAEAYVAMIERAAIHAPDPAVERGLTPDPGDDYLVALARQAHANAIVSGDPHLTGLKKPVPPVLTPREALTLLV
jgi:uncharacterized protein